MKLAVEQAYAETMHYIKNLTKFGINLGLERITSLLRRLGDPQNKLKIIHIGGTNGKGSTAAMVQAVLMQGGYQVGMFVSPHLHDYRERIRINNDLISQEDLIKGIARLRPVLEAMAAEKVEHPTEFEVSTALALNYFAEKQPDFVVLEVGLGGEIDSTNVVTPILSVLTSIGMDHMDYLGETLAEITQNKAGIIKQGVPVVTSVDKAVSLQIITEQANRKGSRLIRVGQEVHWQKANNVSDDSDTPSCMENPSCTDNRNALDYQGLHGNYEALALSLYGEHQFINAATALAACEVLEELGEVDFSDPRSREKAFRQGLGSVQWPGRLELLSQRPKILLDGAHNADGMQALGKALQQYADGPFQRKRLWLCIGMLQDKEIEKAMALIAPLADEIIITKPESVRAGNWEAMASFAEKYLEPNKVHRIEDPVQAVQEGLKRMDVEDMLCVTGSLYMIAPVRAYLQRYLNSV